jgi:peptide deformylase
VKLKICQAGEPVLRRRARRLALEEIKSPAIQQLIELMRETMRDAPGVGLAAPQVGEAVQLAVIEDTDEYQKMVPPHVLAERGRKSVPFHVIINPVIELDESARATFFEGCLSVDGYAALVPRATSVRVECLNERGEARLIEAQGWYARILQHEIDHLRGTLYVDRMHTRSFINKDIYAKLWHARSAEEVERAFLAGEDEDILDEEI